jgi:hypothetical protein
VHACSGYIQNESTFVLFSKYENHIYFRQEKPMEYYITGITGLSEKAKSNWPDTTMVEFFYVLRDIIDKYMTCSVLLIFVLCMHSLF